MIINRRLHIFPAAVDCVTVTSPNRLADAVTDFNLVFDYNLKLPMLPEHVEMAAEFAALRGRQDIADGLRSALAQTLCNDD